METSLSKEFIQRGFKRISTEDLNPSEIGDLLDAIEMLRDVRLVSALEFVSEKFTPEKLGALIVAVLHERLQQIASRREDLYTKYADQRRQGRMLDISSQLGLLERVEKSIRADLSAGIVPKPLGEFIGVDEMDQIKSLGFVGWFKTSGLLFSTYTLYRPQI